MTEDYGAKERARFHQYAAAHPDYRRERIERERARRAAVALLKDRHPTEYLILFHHELLKRGIQPAEEVP